MLLPESFSASYTHGYKLLQPPLQATGTATSGVLTATFGVQPASSATLPCLYLSLLPVLLLAATTG